MTEHTPWRIGYDDGSGAHPHDESFTIQTLDGEMVVDATEGDTSECASYAYGVLDYDDARRIVAAVNATAGIPVAALESGVVGEMREALMDCADVVSVLHHKGESNSAVKKARAAEAKAKPTGGDS